MIEFGQDTLLLKDLPSFYKEEYLKDEPCFSDTEYVECVYDILENKAFQSMKNYMQHGQTSTLTHCIHVSYYSYRICRKFGWDYKTAARGGLLHDLFLYDWHIYCKETGERLHGFYHPRRALINAEKEFTLTNGERDIILKHMWPLTVVPPKHKEGFVVMYADKICGLRETVFRF